MINYNLKINFQDEKVLSSDLTFVSGDIGAYKLIFDFYDNGKKVDVSKYTLTVKAKRADGVKIASAGEIENGQAVFIPENNIYEIPGDLYLEVALCDATGKYITAKIIIASVIEGLGEADLKGADVSSVYVTLLGNLQSKIDQANQLIHDSIPVKGVDYFDGKDGVDGKDGIDGKDGVDGKDGIDGKDGYTPIKGVDYFDGRAGRDGEDGKDGADGYTPIKGVDYYTDAERLEFLEEIKIEDGYTHLTLITGSQLDESGNIVEKSSWSHTDYISCSGLKYIAFNISENATNATTRGWFYDAEYNPLSSFSHNVNAKSFDFDQHFSVPENAAYFILSGHDYYTMKHLKMVSPDYMDLQYAKNGVDNLDREHRHFEIIPGFSINNDGTINQFNSIKCITNFIPCKNDDVLHIDINLTATAETQKNHWFYDADKNAIPNSKFALEKGENRIVVPKNAEYFVLSAYLSEVDALKNANISTTIRTDLDKIIGDLYIDKSQISDVWIANAQTAYNSMLEKMKELSYDGIPFFIQTDAHGLSNDPAKWVDNIDKRIKNINLGDIVLGNFNFENAKAYCDSTERLVNLITVYGNHDVQYDSASDEIASYYALNECFPSVNRRNKDKHSYFTVVDDTYNVKYVVLCPYYLTDDGTGKEYKFKTDQMKWLLEELTKNDGYDIVVLMHEPLKHTELLKRDGTTYSYTDQQDSLYSLVWDVLVKRKKKESGSITDSDGIVHQYDFTNCTSDYLCSLHGHTHRELYYTDEITAYIADGYRYTNNIQGNQKLACNFGVIDRLNRKLFIYKFDLDAVYDTWELTI